KKISISLNILDLVILLFYAYNSVRLLFTEFSAFDNDKFITLTLLICYYFIFKHLVSYQGKYIFPLIVLLCIFLVVGLLQSLIGLFQVYNLFGYSSPFYSLTGSFDNLAPYSGFIVTFLPFAFGLYFLTSSNSTENKILKYLGLVLFCSGILVLPLTKIRGDWLASIGGLLVIINYRYRLNEKFCLLKLNSAVKILIIGSILASLVFSIYGLYKIRPASAYGRILMWKVTANMIEENPMFGIGFNKYGDFYNNYQSAYFSAEKRDDYEKYVADNVDYAHNDLLEIFAELGVIGFGLFILILFYTLKTDKVKYLEEVRNNHIIVAAKASIICIVISSQFTFSLQILATMLNFVFLLSLISAFDEKKYFTLIEINPFRQKVIGIIGLFLLVILTIHTTESYKANKKWQNAKLLSGYMKYDSAIKYYSESYEKLNSNGRFLLNYGGTLSLAGNYNKAIEILKEAQNYNSSNNLYILLGNSYTELKRFDEAEKSYLKAISSIPNRLYPKYKLTQMFLKSDRLNDAKELALDICKSNAKVPSTAENEIKAEMKKILEL
ncbi:MAG: O-antigen ligase family protein, partial [Ignavibacteriae bacterium]|nr:O-antigen ligase family protein [Ignavibacteriota bacterium]